MMIMAERRGEGLTGLCLESFEVVESGLREISNVLPLLKSAQQFVRHKNLTGLPRLMFEAVAATGETSLTPMAAVAGVMADAVADWLRDRGASRVVVNNGGDVALRLAGGEAVRVGLVSDLSAGQVDGTVTVTAESGIGGIATSGLGGRSFTRGVASGVSAFAARCALADALATHLANTSFIASENVATTLAGNLDPDSDIRDLPVVVAVGGLSAAEAGRAIRQVEIEAERLRGLGHLSALRARVGDKTFNLGLENL
ncbi:hypothetical protein LJB86_00450 [Deltaproteobacteria bacterium OttesenSCG-928-M10]|nr:hypothetical protein [Deltaproteobacteria bacterium OttesenSCG-928-M10]